MTAGHEASSANFRHRTPATQRREIRYSAESYQEESVEYRQLGKSGLQVSAIGLGGNTFGRYADEAGTAAIVHRALDLGVNFIDTADTYGRGVSEELVGKAMKDRRHQAIIATKAAGVMGEGPNQAGASRQHLTEGVHDSLRRLDTD